MSIQGNEIVDKAAKEARQNGCLIHLGWSFKDPIKVIELILRGERATEYSRIMTIKGKYYGRLFLMTMN